jgi:hypothetical protein
MKVMFTGQVVTIVTSHKRPLLGKVKKLVAMMHAHVVVRKNIKNAAGNKTF